LSDRTGIARGVECARGHQGRAGWEAVESGDQNAELDARSGIDESMHVELVERTRRVGIGGHIESAGEIVERIRD
jgi:hypothetical protein